MARSTMYDFIVIGAGIAGASIAYELSKHARVCVLEQEEMPGLHSTGRSAALLSLSYGGALVRTLTRAGRDFLRAPPEGFASEPLLIPRPQLFLGRPEQRERVMAVGDAMRSAGGAPRLVEAGEAKCLIPLLRDDYAGLSVMDPDVADIDVDVLHQGYLRGARARGAMILTRATFASPERKDGVWEVRLADQQICAPVVVNAAGAWADQVALACGAPPLGLSILRRTAMLIDPPAGVDVSGWPAVMDPDEQFYFKPDAGKLLLSPADETPDLPGDAQPDELDIAIAVDRLQGPLNIEVRRVSHRWAGLRVFASDRAPVLGFDDVAVGFFWCAGQGGTGVQTAPAMAQLGAALLKGEVLPAATVEANVSVHALSPNRFAA